MVKVYRLKEIGQNGRSTSETFKAPDDDVALSRVLEVSTAAILEVWCGAELVARVDRRHLSSCVDFMAEASRRRH